MCVCVCARVQVQAELKKRLWKWQTQSYLSYNKRRRTLFTESSTITQISVLDKSSPKDHPTAAAAAASTASELPAATTCSSVSPVRATFEPTSSLQPTESHSDSTE